jgi:hypothetical protein
VVASLLSPAVAEAADPGKGSVAINLLLVSHRSVRVTATQDGSKLLTTVYDVAYVTDDPAKVPGHVHVLDKIVVGDATNTATICGMDEVPNKQHNKDLKGPVYIILGYTMTKPDCPTK